MAITFVGTGNGYGAYNGSGITERYIDKPGGTADGDIMIATMVINATTDPTIPGWTSPSGWTQLWDEHITAGGTDYHWIVEWKRAGASEPGSYTWSWSSGSGSTYSDGFIVSYSGANTGTVIDGYSTGPATSNTTHTAPSLNPTYTNDMHVAFAAEDNYGNWTPPSGYTERFDSSSWGNTLSDKLLSSSSPTGAISFTSTASGGGMAGSILLIDASPAGGGGATINLASATTGTSATPTAVASITRPLAITAAAASVTPAASLTVANNIALVAAATAVSATPAPSLSITRPLAITAAPARATHTALALNIPPALAGVLGRSGVRRQYSRMADAGTLSFAFFQLFAPY